MIKHNNGKINKNLIKLLAFLSLPITFVLVVFFFFPDFFKYIYYLCFVFDVFEVLFILLIINACNSKVNGYGVYAVSAGILLFGLLIVLLLFIGGGAAFLYYSICQLQDVWTVAVVKTASAFVFPAAGILIAYIFK